MKEKSSGFPSSLKVTYMLCMWWVRGEAVFAGRETREYSISLWPFVTCFFSGRCPSENKWEGEQDTNPGAHGLLFVCCYLATYQIPITDTTLDLH